MERTTNDKAQSTNECQITKLKAQIKAGGSFDIEAFGLCLAFGF